MQYIAHMVKGRQYSVYVDLLNFAFDASIKERALFESNRFCLSVDCRRYRNLTAGHVFSAHHDVHKLPGRDRH